MLNITMIFITILGIGDTPTIYAGSDIGDEKQDDEDKPEDEKGLSIFGIPIPSLPISLSFGLAPAISQFMANGGLLPLGNYIFQYINQTVFSCQATFVA